MKSFLSGTIVITANLHDLRKCLYDRFRKYSYNIKLARLKKRGVGGGCF